jgi:hypothetical protein
MYSVIQKDLSKLFNIVVGTLPLDKINCLYLKLYSIYDISEALCLRFQSEERTVILVITAKFV